MPEFRHKVRGILLDRENANRRIYPREDTIAAFTRLPFGERRTMVMVGETNDLTIRMEVMCGVATGFTVEGDRIVLTWQTNAAPPGLMAARMVTDLDSLEVGAIAAGMIDENRRVTDLSIHGFNLVKAPVEEPA